jgi:hypothetical protein
MGKIVLWLILIGAACGGDDGYDTFREAATAICEAACSRANECDDSVDISNCSNSCVGDICDLGDCAEEFDGSSADVNDCIDALDDYPCANDDFPAACNDVL